MPDVKVSLNECRGDEENTHQEEASGSREAESEQAKSPEKEIEALGPVMGRISCNNNKHGWVNQ